jgi:hypothetical protein
MLLLTATVETFSQQTKSDVTLIKKDGKYMIEYNDKQFIANEKVLTVKYKDSSYIKSNLEIIRKNKQGFIDIKVPEKKNIEEFAKELKESGFFEIVEFNAYGEYNTFIPSDSLISNQWYLSNINIYDAWDIVMGGPCVVVGILDSGTDWEHDDIGAGSDSYQNIFLNPGEDAWSDINDPSTGNGMDDDGNGLIDDWKGWNYANNSNDSRPVFYHGTFVSGITSAKTNNGRGIAGVSGGNNSSGIRLLPYCIGLNFPDGSVVDDAIIDAVDLGVKVINLSISITSSTAINAAIQYAISNNVVVVASSGNESSSSVSYPASNSNVIAVGATTTSNTRASFSNYGTKLDIVAPGVDIYSTTPNDNYDTESGTSFAAPQVSAAAALLFSMDNTLTAQEVRNILEGTAQKVGGYSYNTTLAHPNGTWNNEMGYGLLNVYTALTEVLNQMDISISGPSLICSSGANFTVNNLPPVDSIIWETGPYLTVDSGQYTNSPVIKATGNGSSWVTARLVTDCGSITLPEQEVWAGAPKIANIDGPTTTPNNQWAYYTAQLESTLSSPTDYNWILNPLNGNSVYDYGQYCDIAFYNSGSYQLVVQAKNTCSDPNYGSYYVTGIYVYDTRSLSFSPNPTTGETTLTIESGTETEALKSASVGEDTFDYNAEWDMEIYSPMQALKTKKTKLKGNSTTIQTAGWTEGVYTVRVKYKDEILTGKLIVRK